MVLRLVEIKKLIAMSQHKEEILNLEYHHKRLSILALNQATSVEEAARLLGLSTSTLYKWIQRFNIKYCHDQKQYIIKN